MTKRKQEWFQVKMEAVAPAVASEVQLSADIIARIDAILKEKKMTQRDLARKMGKSDAVVSRWTTGFPNLTLRSIAEISTALGEPLIRVTEDTLDDDLRGLGQTIGEIPSETIERDPRLKSILGFMSK